MKFIVKERDYEYEYLLTPGVIIVGRDETCDLTIASQSVSRRHMSCSIRKDRVDIKDLGSRNGVKINGERVKESSLSDGDEVRIGEVSLTLKMSAGSRAAAPAGAPGETADEAPPAADPQIEDDEMTPSEGSLVHVDPGQRAGGLYERNGHWYVCDPATGREVEIVPAEQKKEKKAEGGRRSLLATRKGRMIMGGAAAAVIILFLLSLFVTEPQQPPETGLSPGRFDQIVQQTLDALDSGDLESAGEHVRSIKGSRFDLGAAESLERLITLWGRLEENFPQYWMETREQLKDLESRHSPARQFVRRHIARIDEAWSEYSQAELAREAMGRNEYEEAYLILSEIPENRPVRRDNIELYKDIESRLRRQLMDRLLSAVDRNRWEEAEEAAVKLMEFFPDARDDLEDKHAEYVMLSRHFGIMREAERAMAEGEYDLALERYGNIPETSRYYDEARRGAERAEEMLVVLAAENSFNGGEAREALDLIQGLESVEARNLRRRITRITDMHSAALEAEAGRDYAEAQQLWTRLRTLERRHESEYFRNAENALASMPEKRRSYARELAGNAEAKYMEGLYREAKETFEKALQTDPDGEIGADGLRRLREEGIREYMRAIHEDDPDRAVRMLRTVMDMLPPDDTYYRRAKDRKDEIKRRLEQ